MVCSETDKLNTIKKGTKHRGSYFYFFPLSSSKFIRDFLGDAGNSALIKTTVGKVGHFNYWFMQNNT